MAKRVKLNVAGSQFDIDAKMVESFPDGRLSKMIKECPDKDSQCPNFTFDRPADSFAAILGFYQTGQLHMPTGVCPGAFKEELIYWGLDPTQLAVCCNFRYNLFLDEQKNLLDFKTKALDNTDNMGTYRTGVQAPITAIRRQVWTVVDNIACSIPAKLYFVLSTSMVFLAIFSLAYSTEPWLQRKLNKCEMIEYLHSIGSHDDAERVQIRTKVDCSKNMVFPDPPQDEWDEWDEWEEYDTDLEDSSLKDEYNELDNAFGDANDSTPSTPPAQPNPAPSPNRIILPDITISIQAFDIMDFVTTAFFTVDLLLRLLSCPSFPRYFTSIINVVDISALVGSYTHIAILSIWKDQRYVTNWLDILLYFQIFRALRLLRIAKNFRAAKVLLYSAKTNPKDLLILALFLIIAVCTFASLIYFSESRKTVTSIPDAWWWALITMTTVGYGDISPVTGLGRFFGAICAITGVLLLSLTLPIFVNNFLTLYQYASINSTSKDASSSPKTGNTSKVGSVLVKEVPKENIIDRSLSVDMEADKKSAVVFTLPEKRTLDT